LPLLRDRRVLACFAGDQARCLGRMGFYFVGGRRSRPMFNVRPLAVKFGRHEPRIFTGMKFLSTVPLPGKHANAIADGGPL